MTLFVVHCERCCKPCSHYVLTWAPDHPWNGQSREWKLCQRCSRRMSQRKFA